LLVNNLFLSAFSSKRELIFMANELQRQDRLTQESTSMKKYLFSLSLALLFTLVIAANAATAQESAANGKYNSPLIGNLKRLHKTYGCDCKLQTFKEARNDMANKFVFQSNLAATPAWMNIDGKDIQLKLMYASPSTKGVTLGSRYYKKYSAKGITILIRYVVSAVCPEENPDCDEEGHVATITVTKGGRRQSIKATGMCGWC
jgi:hypothetical protein